MKIIPFGKKRDQQDVLSVFSDHLDGEAEESLFDSSSNSSSPGRTKIDEVQRAIEGIVGEPSLDNLMIILAAIGMTQIGIKVSGDNSSLSVSGVIDISEPDTKISKKD